MTSNRVRPVAIVGGGFSGTMVAAQLARRNVAAVLIEGGARAGRGIAYSTQEPAHVLNVRAEAMSAWAEDADHFARLVEQEGGDRHGFAERAQFGRYLRAILAETLKSGRLDIVEQPAVAARPRADGWTVALEGGGSFEASALVLAIGNQPPEPLPFSNGSSRMVDNPWGSEALAAVEHIASTQEAVLLVGTGLTMVDAVLSLDAACHRGRVVALSRRGLIPRGHADFKPAPVAEAEVPEGNVRALWRWLRRRGAEVGWRAAVDALRPHSQRLWQSFSLSEQKRFVRHARPWWDVHRHRIAPEVASRVRRLVAEGRLEIIAGRIESIEEDADGLAVSWRRRGSSRLERERFAYAINCTGPLGTIARSRDPLLRQMLQEGLVRPDQLGIALDVDERSRIVGSSCAWAMGPLTKGRYWEITAVPDIRHQAAEVAEDIARELGR